MDNSVAVAAIPINQQLQTKPQSKKSFFVGEGIDNIQEYTLRPSQTEGNFNKYCLKNFPEGDTITISKGKIVEEALEQEAIIFKHENPLRTITNTIAMPLTEFQIKALSETNPILSFIKMMAKTKA